MLNLCKEKNMNINQLGIASGINPTTIRSSLKQIYSTPNTATLYYICLGFNISMKDFFDDASFSKAVELLKQGKSNRVVIMKADRIEDVDINEGLSMTKTISEDDYVLVNMLSR